MYMYQILALTVRPLSLLIYIDASVCVHNIMCAISTCVSNYISLCGNLSTSVRV